MEVFDIMGKHVKTLVDENQTAGFKTIKWMQQIVLETMLQQVCISIRLKVAPTMRLKNDTVKIGKR